MKGILIYSAVAVSTTVLALIPFTDTSDTPKIEPQKQISEENIEDVAKKEQEKAAEEKAKIEAEEKAKKEAEEKEKQQKQEQEKKEHEQQAQQSANQKKTPTKQEIASSAISNETLEKLRKELLVYGEDNSNLTNIAIYMLNTGEIDTDKAVSTLGYGSEYEGLRNLRTQKYSFSLSEREVNATLDQLKYKLVSSKEYGLALNVTSLGNMYQFEIVEVY